jgi:hypothetical protein
LLSNGGLLVQSSLANSVTSRCAASSRATAYRTRSPSSTTPKVESLPRSFHANFLELEWTFCEHRYRHDDRSIRKQIRSSNSIPSSILLCESLSSYRHQWLSHAVIAHPCRPHRPSRSDSHSQLEHCQQRGIGDDIQGHSGWYSHAGQQCARRKQIAKIYCRQP